MQQSLRLTRRLAAGALAGAIGTMAMDLHLYRQYRGEGGKEPLLRWEFAAGVTNWNGASAPGQVGRRLLRAVTRNEPPDKWARSTTNLVHWATGVGWGIQYGVVAPKFMGRPWLSGITLGSIVWLSSYAVLGPAMVYKPIWEYDTATLAKDLSAHVVYGSAVAATLAAMRHTQREPSPVVPSSAPSGWSR
jgi:hypothetical protein